jgi:hypothetical protein
MPQTRYRISNEIGREATPRTFESIQNELERLYLILSDLSAQVAAGGGGGSSSGGAPVDAQYVLGIPNATLINGLVATDDTDIAFDKATPAQIKAIFADRAALSVLGNPTNAVDRPIPIVAAADDTFLKRSGTSLVFAAITPGDVSGFNHNLLSAVHPDTVPASPEVGSVVVGVAASPVDTGLYWFDGQPLPGVASELDPGGNAYWFDGQPYDVLGLTLTDAVWQKLVPTVPNSVLTWDGSSVAFAPLASVFAGAKAYRSTNLAVTGGAWQTVPWSAAAFDTGFWDVTAPSRFTVPTGKTGTYQLTATAFWQTDATVTSFLLGWRVNGTTVLEYAATANVTDVGMQATALVQLEEGDYVEAIVDYASGSMTGRTITGGTTTCVGSIVKVG